MKIFIAFIFTILAQVVNAQSEIKIADSVKKKYKDVFPCEINGYYFVRNKKEMTGIIDSAGNEIIKPKFAYIGKFINGLAESGNEMNKKFKRGLIDFSGKIIVPFMYDDIYRYGTDKCIVSIENKSGVINNENKILIPIKYEYITEGNENIIMVRENGLYGFIGEDGKAITPIMYSNAERFYGGGAIVWTTDRKCGIINPKGKYFFEPNKNYAFKEIKNGFVIAIKLDNGKYGIFNLQGKVIVPAIYDELNIESNCFKVIKKGKVGLLNFENKIIVPIEYYGLYNQIENDFLAAKNNRQGVIDYNNNVKIPIIFQGVQFVADKFYIVTTFENKNGVYNLNGNKILDTNIKVFNYYNEKVFAIVNGKNYIINLVKPEEKTLCEIDAFKENNNTWFYGGNNNIVAIKDNKFGVINIKNEIVVPFNYEDVRELSASKRFIVKLNGKYGMIDSNNNTVHKFIYDNITIQKETMIFIKDGKRVNPKNDN